MAIEKYWTRQGPVAFTANGTESGLITVSNVACFKVKQRVVISSNTQPNLQLQVKRIPSLTQIIVGPLKDDKQRNIKNLNLRTDLSAYTVADNAMVRAEEQSKVTIPKDDIWQAVYEFEPTVALRSILVDKVGNNWDSDNPLPVLIPPGSIDIGAVEITDGQDNLSINNDGSINVNVVDSTDSDFKNIYGEVSSVANQVLTNIVNYTVPVGRTAIFNRVEVSGTNIAEYEVVVNGNVEAKKRTYFGSSLNEEFVFGSGGNIGLSLSAGDTVVVRNIHNRPMVGDFEARIQVIEV